MSNTSVPIPRQPGKPLKTLIGQRYGRLVVKNEIERRIQPNGQTVRMFLCQCDCGLHANVSLGNLRSSHTQSCGCYHREKSVQTATIHGKSNHAIYNTWKHIRQRCLNPKCASYPRYGGRGITLCQRWKDSFSLFFEDMAESYRMGLSIDRVDNDGPYSPENCRWATPAQQNRNKRNNHLITWHGETHSLIDWIPHLPIQIDYHALQLRINIHGWSIERAFTQPLHSRH